MQSDGASHHNGCPVDADTKAWIDARASWLLGQFGWERFKSCSVVLPTVEFFPSSFRETGEDARALLDRLCELMGLHASDVELSLYHEGERIDGGETTLGLYENEGDQFRIWVEVSALTDPLGLAATMAHELGHVHLLGHRRLTEDDDDHEPLTDLLTVFLGLGVITANAAFHDSNWQSGNMEGWQVARQGYLTMPMYGYALALFSRVRDEYLPTWDKHLRPDVRNSFRKSLDFFEKHGFPYLRSVKTTSARPTLNRPTAPVDGEEYAEEMSEESQDGAAVCSFCGTPLVDGDHEGICEECQGSIDENQHDLMLDRQENETASLLRQGSLRWGCLLTVVVLLVLTILEWLGVSS